MKFQPVGIYGIVVSVFFNKRLHDDFEAFFDIIPRNIQVGYQLSNKWIIFFTIVEIVCLFFFEVVEVISSHFLDDLDLFIIEVI